MKRLPRVRPPMLVCVLLLSACVTAPRPGPALPPRPACVDRAAVLPGTPAPAGRQSNLDADCMAQVVRAAAPILRVCYEDGLRRNPGLATRVDVHMTVGPLGRTLGVGVRGLAAAPEVRACIAGRLGQLDYPRPLRGAADFDLPLDFSP